MNKLLAKLKVEYTYMRPSERFAVAFVLTFLILLAIIFPKAFGVLLFCLMFLATVVGIVAVGVIISEYVERRF